MPAAPAPPCANAQQTKTSPGPGPRDSNSAPERLGRPLGAIDRGLSSLVPGLGQIPGSEAELRQLVEDPRSAPVLRKLRSAACVGYDTDVFHPEGGPPSELTLARCSGCPARLACLALALRSEDPEARSGWYGGLGPADRDAVASALNAGVPAPPRVPELAARAARLWAEGWTVPAIAAELMCCDRTVQRYLRMAAA